MRPGGPWDDLRTSGSTTKDTLRSMFEFHLFSIYLRTILTVFLSTLDQNRRPWVSFGMLGASTLHPGAPRDDPGSILGHGEYKKGHFEVQWLRSRLGFYRFLADLGDLF